MMYVYVVTLIGAIAYSAICGFLYVNQRSLLFFPTPNVELTDSPHIKLQLSDQSLKIWVLNEGKQQAIIYFGGNAEGVEANISSFRSMFADYTVYLPNYRGFGGSSGEPSEQALFSDALYLYDYVKKNHQSLSVIGRSLGSGVATYLAANRELDRLVLITPYDSIVNVAQQAYPLFPVSLLLHERFESVAIASGVSSRILLIIAEHDEMISRKSSDTLAAAFPSEHLTKVILAGHDHNSLTTDPEYNRILAAFFNNGATSS